MCLLKQFGMNIKDWLKMYFCKNGNLPSTILDTNKEGHYNLSSLVAKTSFTTTLFTTQCGEFRASNFIIKDCSFNQEIEFNILVNILQLSCLRQ